MICESVSAVSTALEWPTHLSEPEAKAAQVCCKSLNCSASPLCLNQSYSNVKHSNKQQFFFVSLMLAGHALCLNQSIQLWFDMFGFSRRLSRPGVDCRHFPCHLWPEQMCHADLRKWRLKCFSVSCCSSAFSPLLTNESRESLALFLKHKKIQVLLFKSSIDDGP